MIPQPLILGLILLAIAAFAGWRGYGAALQMERGGQRLHSRPHYHAVAIALHVLIPAILLWFFWVLLESFLRLSVDQHYWSAWLRSLTLSLLTVGLGMATVARVSPRFMARSLVERYLRAALLLSATFAVLVTVAIMLSVLFESLRFFQRVPVFDFLFGTHWSPQTALRADQGGSSGSFGAIPLFVGTLLITAIALLVAVPLGLLSAVYLSEYATSRQRALAKPALEMLAGIPTVVYGYFAAITVAPFLRGFGSGLGLDIASESALAAGLVMGVMIIPYVSSLADDVINAVPQTLRDASYAMGSTRSEAICRVVLPAATPGIIAAVLLAVSRAVGETMIVVMAAGLAANLTFNPLDAVTTVTVQMVALLVGDQEFDSAKTLASFALGLTLFLITLMLNIAALRIVKNYRLKYA
jgi:phosphate transport system permease protein